MKEKSYAPRPGTKVALAVSAMLDGPTTIPELGKAMSCPPKDVNAMLFVALKSGYMVKVKDETGLLHYALDGMPLDDQFKKVGETDKTEEPATAKSNWNQGAFPMNPFPVAATSTPTAPPQDAVKSVKSPTEAAKTAAPPSKPAVAAAPARKFVAGLFSNGELTISVDDHRLTLCKDHTSQLLTFLKNIKEAA